MPDDFVIARNPEAGSTLPWLIRVPLPGRPIVLKARETWPRTAKVYCHRAESWPADAEVVERVPVRSCVRRGAAIDLVLDRARESRSQLVLTHVRGGREAIFWQSPRTVRKARPGVRTPSARAAGQDRFTVLVDSHERYPYRFAKQQVDVARRALAAGDYAVERDGRLLASVERKSLEDLVSSLVSGRLGQALAELAALAHAAVVVEERWSAVFTLERVRPAVVADGLAELAVRWPHVPVFFAETRPLAEEWTFRFLGAALAHAADSEEGARRLAGLVTAGAVAAAPVTVREVRAWALATGWPVAGRGRLRPEVLAAWSEAHPERPATSL